MTPPIWLSLLAAAFLFNGAMAIRAWRHERRLVAELLILVEKIDCVLDLLMIWSQTWGRDPDEVKLLLLDRLAAYDSERE